MSHQRHLAQEEGIRFFYSPEQPRRGDKVRLNATVLDQLGVPVKSGKVTVTIRNPAGVAETVELLPEDNEWGLHTGMFVPREGGKYELLAEGVGVFGAKKGGALLAALGGLGFALDAPLDDREGHLAGAEGRLFFKEQIVQVVEVAFLDIESLPPVGSILSFAISHR